MSLEDQFSTLYLMVLSGFVLAFVFDILQIVAEEFHLPSWMTALLDIAYWIAALLFVFQILYHHNDGQIRLFVFLGLFAGGFLYFKLLSRLTRKIGARTARWIVRFVRWWAKLLYSLLVAPMLFLTGWFYRLILFLGGLSIFLLKFVLQLVYPLWMRVSKNVKHWFHFNRK